MLASGWLFEEFGGPAFLAMAGVSAAGGLMALALHTHARRAASA
jgi:hypothetical protein